MLLLPLFNAALARCPVGPVEFTPHPQGHFCGQCQRVVHDFSQSTNPRADLAAARTAAPDGRVCGRFGATQVQAVPRLSRRLRWFVAALVLVVTQGLSAREALAQVRRAASNAKPAAAKSKQAPPRTTKPADQVYGMVAEQMPSFRGGSNREVIQYIQQQLVWPQQNGKLVQAEGRVFASFTVDKDGRVRNPKIMRSLQPLLDAEVLRVLRLMPNFEPGQQNGEPVAVGITVPITFKKD